MKRKHGRQFRGGDEFLKLVNLKRSTALKNGSKMSTSEVTNKIAKMFKKDKNMFRIFMEL